MPSSSASEGTRFIDSEPMNVATNLFAGAVYTCTGVPICWGTASFRCGYPSLSLGEPEPAFPRPWSVYRWLQGEPATVEGVHDFELFAHDLSVFLAAL
jgi:hypothetical protein